MMAYRDILVHVDHSAASVSRMAIAVTLARRFDARLIAYCAFADSNVAGMASRDRLNHLGRGVARLEVEFGLQVEAAGIRFEWKSSISFDDERVPNDIIAQARTCDLVILGQYDPASADGSIPPNMVETVVLRSGRPVLVVPYAGHFEDVGHRVTVAWNASREAARAVADALPFLTKANQSTILALVAKRRGEPEIDISPLDLRAHLHCHGVAAECDRLVFDPTTIDPAERLLSHLADAGSDLLVIGGSGQILGRASTRRSLSHAVLQRATVPTLISY